VNFFEKVNDFLVSQDLKHDSLSAWETYLGEAIWGWELIRNDIDSLVAGSRVLEVGAGPQVLTSQVALQDLVVTAIEPANQGFSVMKELGIKVTEAAKQEGIKYKFIETTGEKYVEPDEFDFAFSINVMEHVEDLNLVLDNVITSLKVGGKYHFVCPNYAFPFEPHFNSVTLLNKRLTDKFIKPRLLTASSNLEAHGLWDSLNWITVRKILRWGKSRNNVKIVFSNRSFNMYVIRSMSDQTFRMRHPKLSKFTEPFQKLINVFSIVVPKRFLPIIDVTITKI